MGTRDLVNVTMFKAVSPIFSEGNWFQIVSYIPLLMTMISLQVLHASEKTFRKSGC